MENVIEIKFDLKEFMSKKRIREDDIVRAMRLIWSLCYENDTCKSCPLRVDGKCQLRHLKRSDVIDKVKRNIQEALYDNHMGKVYPNRRKTPSFSYGDIIQYRGTHGNLRLGRTCKTE